MCDVSRMFALAAKTALDTRGQGVVRNFLLGAVGRRKDGAIVVARNAAATFGQEVPKFAKLGHCHAETRAVRKMDCGGELFVVRVSKGDLLDGEIVYRNARPCEICQNAIRAKHLRKVYYTIGKNEFGQDIYGVWDPIADKDVIYRL
jgi:tRNA(Arg) A34 adenosine deaminase TadA